MIISLSMLKHACTMCETKRMYEVVVGLYRSYSHYNDTVLNGTKHKHDSMME